MILDKLTEFADAVSAVGEAGTQNVGDTIDLGAGRDIAQGRPLYLVVTVAVAADGGGGNAATIAYQIASDSAGTLATSGQTIHFTSGAMLKALNTLGAKHIFALPIEGQVYERYLGFQVVTAVEGEDALFVNAFLTLDPHGNKSYPDAIN